MKYRSSTPCFLMMKMLLHLWQLCLVHPWHFPFQIFHLTASIAGVQVGYVDGQIIINPSQEQAEQSLLELTVAGTKHAINMVESGAKELSEEIMLEALLKGHEAVKELIAFQEEIVAAVGKEKAEVELLHVDADLQAEIIAAYNSDLQKAVQVEEKLAREAATQAVKDQVTAVYEEKYATMKNLTVSCVMWLKSWNKWNTLKCAV